MDEGEFIWFKHFMNEMIPALTRAVMQPQVDAYFDLGGDHAWHIPEGDIRRLNRILAEIDDEYRSLQAHEFM